MNRQILYLDSSLMNCLIVRRVVQAAGYGFLEANDSQQGLTSIREDRPDLLMINIDSAGTDNRLALITELKADVDLQTIPIIALIEPEQEQLAEAARQAGCDDVVMKPLDIRQMQVLLMQATIDWPPLEA